MPRRLHPTLVDYVVIAINPAIIMVLIASLVFFLLEMFYQGEYPARLHYCLTLFIVGAVLIGRISIEEGWERASIFAAAMAVAICLAMQKFVSYKGTNFEQFGWALNLGLIALTWWCAFKLTWDCTLIDESQDASGQGLIQTAGLDSPDDEAAKKVGPACRAGPGARPAGDTYFAAGRCAAGDAVGGGGFDLAGRSPVGWWNRGGSDFSRRRRRPHAPACGSCISRSRRCRCSALGRRSFPNRRR